MSKNIVNVTRYMVKSYIIFTVSMDMGPEDIEGITRAGITGTGLPSPLPGFKSRRPHI